MSNTKRANTHFTLNFVKSEINGFQSSFDKAGKGVKPYYQELAKLMKAHPSFSCVIKEMEVKTDKEKYSGLKLEIMEKYISLILKDEKLLEEFLTRKDFEKKNKLAVYPHLKKWFLGKVGKGFSVAKATEEIREAEVRIALLTKESGDVHTDVAAAEPAHSEIVELKPAG